MDSTKTPGYNTRPTQAEFAKDQPVTITRGRVAGNTGRILDVIAGQYVVVLDEGHNHCRSSVTVSARSLKAR